jgi:competence protein ComEA
MTVSHAIYGTGWDGSVVLEGDKDGDWTLLTGEGAPPEEGGPKVNLNTATAEELSALPMIGGKRAEAIIDFRAAHGAFARIEELDDVEGIGPATVNAIKDLVTIGG